MKKIDERSDGRLLVSVHLVPRSSKNSVVGWTGSGTLKISVTAPPSDGAANRRLVEFLSKSLEVPRTEIVVVSGARSRLKRLAVPGICKNRLLRFSEV